MYPGAYRPTGTTHLSYLTEAAYLSPLRPRGSSRTHGLAAESAASGLRAPPPIRRARRFLREERYAASLRETQTPKALAFEPYAVVKAGLPFAVSSALQAFAAVTVFWVSASTVACAFCATHLP